MARINFNQIFERNAITGVITPRTIIRVGGISFGAGVAFGLGVSFWGIDLSRYINNDFEVDIAGDIFIIKGIYTDNAV